MTTEAGIAGPAGHPAGPGADPGLVQVRLLGVPLELLVSAREHHDGLMREFRLLALAGRTSARDAPLRLVELTHILGQQYAATNSRRDQEVDEALARGVTRLDLVHEVPPAVADAAVALSALMTEADAYCAAEQLMTLERHPLLKRFGDWYLDQFVVQCAGGEPVAWDGPLAFVP